MAQITLNSTGVASSGSLVLQTNGTTTAATIDTAQNFGLGVTPSANAGVSTLNIANYNRTFSALTLGSNANSAGYIGYNMGNTSTSNTWKYISADTGSALYFAGNEYRFMQFASGSAGATTSGTQAMTLDASGNLLVGKTSFGGTATGGEIGANGVVNSYSPDTTNSSSTFAAYSNGASAYRFYVGWGGTIFATSTTITAISDQRLKENIRDLDDGLASVMALKPRKFDWKEGKGANIKDARGFIAQEFEAVFPDMIDEWRDPAPEGEEPYKAINANLIPTLVKAIQELKAEFDAYKASHP